MCLSHLSSTGEPNRSIIQETGIFQSLWYLVQQSDGMNCISNFICEVLQLCIVGKQYEYAYQQIQHTWPTPRNRVMCRVDTVLRYYYLRGIVGMGCCYGTSRLASTNRHYNKMNDAHMHAIRCFWTCLSIPSNTAANAVSAVAIAAYKKLILLQALSPLGILHTSMVEISNDRGNNSKPADDRNNDNSVASVILPPDTSMSTSSYSSIDEISATNPFSKPTKEMSNDLLRFISQAKPSESVPLSTSDRYPITMRSNIRGNDGMAATTHDVHTMDTSSVSNGPEIGTHQSNRMYPHLGVHGYKQLVQAFVKVDRRTFDLMVQEYQDVFMKDGNFGLIRRLSNALYYRQIYVISRTYSTIPMLRLCNEMNVSIDQLRLLLHNLEMHLSWPVQVVTISASSTTNPSSKTLEEPIEAVMFPSDLPRPILFESSNETMHVQMMELSKTVQQLSMTTLSSPKYNAAIVYYNRIEQGGGPRSAPMMVDDFTRYQ
jgi:PCI domain